MEKHTHREPFRGLSQFQRETRKREQFTAHVPLAMMELGEHMREHGLMVSGVSVLEYECLIQITLRPDQVEAWLASGVVLGSKTTNHESPFGPMQRRGVSRVVFQFQLGSGIQVELVTFHELAAVGGVL